MSQPLFNQLSLSGLDIAPPQTLGPIRLFPVINPAPRADIRIGLQGYDTFGIVDLEGREDLPKKQYWSYVPQGFIISWGKDGKSAAAFETDLRKNVDSPAHPITVHHRMAKRTGAQQMRILPLHLAMEGFLSLHFGGPSIAWSNYSKHTRTFGLSPRCEFVTGADRIDGLAEAMRLFEIHDNQVGVLVFVADSLASAFVVSHPEDYRRLHASLLQDFFGEIFVHYARHAQVGSLGIDLDPTGVTDLATLSAAAADVRRQWNEMSEVFAKGLLGRPLNAQLVNRMGHFHLERFTTNFQDADEGHIGEVIVHQSGAVQYLKTYRLSKNQIKRAHLLQLLADHEWEIEALAAAQGDEPDDVIRRMHNVGFGYLLNPEVLARARRR